MPIVIAPESPATQDARTLIDELESQLAAVYPDESRHGYSVDKLIREGVAFFIARDDGTPAACGGVQLVGRDYGEVKRMYVRPAFRGRGVGRMILDRLTEHTASHAIELMRLETGIHQTAAIALYERAGFRDIPPFGPYKPDPLSRFFEKSLTGTR